MTGQRARTVPELAAVVREASSDAGDIRVTFNPHRAGVHIVVGSGDLGPMLCGWVHGWTPGEPFPATTDWSMTVTMAPYDRCQHAQRAVIW